MKTMRMVLSLILLMVCSLELNAQGGTHWQCDIYDYEYDMAIYFNLQKGEEVITDYSDIEVAAFIGNECRGVAEFQTITDADNHAVKFGYIRIRSNQTEGETVTLMVWQKNIEKAYSITDRFSFKALDLKGLPSSPTILHMADVLLGDANNDGYIDAADLSAVTNYILGRDNTVFISEAADMNSDGIIDASDLSAITNIILGK